MKKKQQFIKPAILREFSLLGDTPILAGSLVGNTTIVSTGQDVQNWDYETGFDHQWGQ